MNKIYMEKDELGEHKVIEQKNGVKVRILKTPSKEYKKKIEKRNEEFKKNQLIRKEKEERERKIKEKMRQMAIEALEKEGKI